MVIEDVGEKIWQYRPVEPFNLTISLRLITCREQVVCDDDLEYFCEDPRVHADGMNLDNLPGWSAGDKLICNHCYAKGHPCRMQLADEQDPRPSLQLRKTHCGWEFRYHGYKLCIFKQLVQGSSEHRVDNAVKRVQPKTWIRDLCNTSTIPIKLCEYYNHQDRTRFYLQIHILWSSTSSLQWIISTKLLQENPRKSPTWLRSRKLFLRTSTATAFQSRNHYLHCRTQVQGLWQPSTQSTFYSSLRRGLGHWGWLKLYTWRRIATKETAAD